MDHYQPHWMPPAKPRKQCGLPLEAGVLVVGVVGSCLGLAALTAYAIVQAPQIRERFGGYFKVTTAEEMDTIHQIGYTVEIIAVVLGGLLGILTNSLLIYGVLRSKRWFLLHWLVFHVFVVAAGLIAAILILLLQTSLYKLYALLPIGVIFTVILCWVKVYEYFCEMQVKLKPPKCKIHTINRMRHHGDLPPWNISGGWGGGYVSDWMAKKDDVLEFYPGDKLSRSMQDRMYESPWREGHSLEKYIENTLYCESEDTDSSIVPTDRNENEYTTLPVECKLHPNRPLQVRYGEEYFMEIPANKNGGRTNDHRDVVSMRGGHVVNGGHKGGHSDKGSYTQEDAAYFREGKAAVETRASQESRTDSNLTNAEI